MTQVLTGHGVFGEYLRRIRRETTDICRHCGEGRDTAQHTLELYPAWELPRYTLRHAIGETLTPSVIVEAMLRGSQEYEVVRLFCERVVLAKERAERERKKNSHPCRIRLWRRMAVRQPRATPPPLHGPRREGATALGAMIPPPIQ
ncbi:uncharacterized protein LOC105680460 [Bombus impatiens]|uniref:Uncharacterized protein LOC105680460 n=1 Tax=Bombus impatiens TaxID=132113 RepID=A0A6P3UPM9_BOMIM|nr:uncharacterized protein LOC105680460 [Bombus impatiens]